MSDTKDIPSHIINMLQSMFDPNNDGSRKDFIEVDVRKSHINDARVLYLIDVGIHRRANIIDWHTGRQLIFLGVPTMVARLTDKGRAVIGLNDE
jgi:hypothetical protein